MVATLASQARAVGSIPSPAPLQLSMVFQGCPWSVTESLSQFSFSRKAIPMKRQRIHTDSRSKPVHQVVHRNAELPDSTCCWGSRARWETWHSTRFQGWDRTLDLTVRQTKDDRQTLHPGQTQTAFPSLFQPPVQGVALPLLVGRQARPHPSARIRRSLSEGRPCASR